MELLEYLNVIKKRWWTILLVTAAAATASAAISMFLLTPIYEAKTTLIIGRTPRSQDEKVQYDVILAYQKLIKTYSELAKSRMIAEETIKSSGYDISPEYLMENLKVSPKGDTQILEIVLQDADPERVVKIANTMSDVFVEKVKSMMNTDDIRLVDGARPPAALVKPNMLFNVIAGILLGLLVSFSIVFLLEHMDTALKSEEQAERILRMPVLESIPLYCGKGDGR